MQKPEVGNDVAALPALEKKEKKRKGALKVIHAWFNNGSGLYYYYILKGKAKKKTMAAPATSLSRGVFYA